MLESPLALFCLFLAVTETPAEAQLRGHGGPVRALGHIAATAAELVSGSFDSTAIRWSLGTGTAETVLRFHEGALNAVAFFRRWAHCHERRGRAHRHLAEGPRQARPRPHRAMAPVVQLAVSPDGKTLASASWDRTARLWPLAGGSAARPGRASARTSTAWPSRPMGAPSSASATTDVADLAARRRRHAHDPHPASPLNAVAVAPDGEIITAGASGKVFFLSAAGDATGEVEAAAAPLIALAISGDGKRVAASSIRGAVAIIDRDSRKHRAHPGRAGPAGVVRAFLPDNRRLLTGGGDRVIRRWNSENGRAHGRSGDRRTGGSAGRPSRASPARRSFAPAWPATR